MAKVWLVHIREDSDLVASTQEIAINWLLEHGYARLDDEPLVETYTWKRTNGKSGLWLGSRNISVVLPVKHW